MLFILLDFLFAAPELLTVDIGGLCALWLRSLNEVATPKIPSQIMNVRFKTVSAEALFLKDTKDKLEAWDFKLAAKRPSFFSLSDDKGSQEWLLTRHNYESDMVNWEPGNHNVFEYASTSTLNKTAISHALKSIQQTEVKDQCLESYSALLESEH